MPDQPTPDRPARGLRIVVVDNDPSALELAVTDLELEGHTVVGSGTSGDDAIALCERVSPDVLVVDHRMPPGPWGLEVAEVVRNRWPSIRVVLYSNYQDREVVRRTQALGATFLAKGNLRSLRRVVAAEP